MKILHVSSGEYISAVWIHGTRSANYRAKKYDFHSSIREKLEQHIAELSTRPGPPVELPIIITIEFLDYKRLQVHDYDLEFIEDENA